MIHNLKLQYKNQVVKIKFMDTGFCQTDKYCFLCITNIFVYNSFTTSVIVVPFIQNVDKSSFSSYFHRRVFLITRIESSFYYYVSTLF